jgi:hypothetical protein
MLLRKPEKALDWQGREVCCTGCVHRELIHEDRCRQKHVCVQDRSPSRIEEFFKTNPEPGQRLSFAFLFRSSRGSGQIR